MNDKLRVLVKVVLSLIPLPILKWWVTRASRPPLEPVAEVDLERYCGKWHQIAHIPNWFQRQCVSGTMLTYSLRDDGKVEVVNQCVTKNGITINARGVAEHREGGKFKVTFVPPLFSFLPFVRASYWILLLDPQYQYAVVGEPSRRYLWILNRTPQIDDRLYDKLIEQIDSLGYATDKLIRDPDSRPTVHV